jgi:hypothetical protein
MRDLLADRASTLKHQSESEPDWTVVVQRLETYLSGQAGAPVLDLLIEEEAREDRGRTEHLRSFATPLEAAQLSSSGVDCALADGRAEDAAVWVSMGRWLTPRFKLKSALVESFLVHVTEETT